MMAKDRDERQPSWQRLIEDIDAVAGDRMPLTPRPEVGRSTVARISAQELRDLRRDRATATATAVGRRTPLAQPPPGAGRAWRKPLAIGAASAALLLAAAAAALLVPWARRSKPAPAYPATPGTTAAATPTPVATAAGQTPADKFAELWAYATKFAQERPDEFDRAIVQFQAVKERAAGSKYELMAADEIHRLEKARDAAATKAVETTLAALAEQAQPATDRQDYAAAAAVYRSYAGPYAAQTEARREELAKQHEAKAAASADERQRAAETARKKVDETLAAVAGDLLGGDETAAATRARALLADQGVAPDKARAEQLAALLTGLGKIDQAVLESFREDSGKPIELAGTTPPLRLTVREVRGDTIHALRHVSAGTVGVQLKLGQIPFAEKRRRVESGDRVAPAVRALWVGLNLGKEGRRADAAKCFAAAGILAGALAGASRDPGERAAMTATAPGPGAGPDSAAAQPGRTPPSPPSPPPAPAPPAAPATVQAAAATATTPAFRRDDPDLLGLAPEVARRIHEARTKTGPLIEISPDGEGDSFTPEEAIPKIKSGMVVRFRGGNYAAGGWREFLAPEVKDLVVEGDGRTVTGLIITLKGCREVFVRRLTLEGMFPIGSSAQRGRSRTSLVDSVVYTLSDHFGDLLVHNAAMQLVPSDDADVQVSSSLVGYVVSNMEIAFKLRATNCLFAPGTTYAFGIQDGLPPEISLENCLIMLDDPTHLGGVFAPGNFPDWMKSKFNKGFSDFAGMAKYAKVKATATEIAGISFEGGKKPNFYLTLPRLAPDSPGKGRGPGGRDLGPNINDQGFLAPYAAQGP